MPAVSDMLLYDKKVRRLYDETNLFGHWVPLTETVQIQNNTIPK